jgi:SAM-dependent methyltransferase
MTSSYFTGVNPELLSRVPTGAAVVIEVGAGAGNFGAAYLSLNPLARYIGLELDESAAHQAQSRLHTVIQGNVEDPATLRLLDAALEGGLADVLIFGDVLEHLRDPWSTLLALRARMRPGGVCVACIPNVSHWSLVQQQLQGRWDYADAGLLDRTHLRFFTLSSATAMFKSSGWEVVDALPRVLWPEKTEEAIKALAPVAAAWGIAPDGMRRDLSAFQWVMRAVNGPQKPRLNVAGLGLRKMAGVTEARVDYPFTALRSQPGVQVVWSADNLSIPRGWEPGVLVLHRSFMNNPAQVQALEGLAARGWLLVSDMDDDPHHWQAYIESNFRAYRGVHAVTVSTQPLAEMIRQWNPEVAVLPNGVMQLPPLAPQTPKSGRPKIFFGALNRKGDWQPLQEALSQAAMELKDEVEWSVVHDQEFFDMLPPDAVKRFQATLAPAAFMQALAECDVSLLPLSDTRFNGLKSDLKFIESCAAGAVPVCSPVVYGAQAEHHEIGVFVSRAEDWKAALITLCRDPAELQRRRSKGLQYVARQRMHGTMAAAREALYRDWFSRRDELEARRQARLATMA